MSPGRALRRHPRSGRELAGRPLARLIPFPRAPESGTAAVLGRHPSLRWSSVRLFGNKRLNLWKNIKTHPSTRSGGRGGIINPGVNVAPQFRMARGPKKEPLLPGEGASSPGERILQGAAQILTPSPLTSAPETQSLLRGDLGGYGEGHSCPKQDRAKNWELGL